MFFETRGITQYFQHKESIHSIASYLKHYGWKRNLSREEAFNVVYHYNHSTYYVDTILKITDLLAG